VFARALSISRPSAALNLFSASSKLFLSRLLSPSAISFSNSDFFRAFSAAAAASASAFAFASASAASRASSSSLAFCAAASFVLARLLS
jgi:hypothetical protein